jgi:hypothetical protein
MGGSGMPSRHMASVTLTIDTDIQFTATSAGANQTMRHAELVGEGALRLPEHRAREQAALDLGDLCIG